MLVRVKLNLWAELALKFDRQRRIDDCYFYIAQNESVSEYCEVHIATKHTYYLIELVGIYERNIGTEHKIFK